eukprot:GDKJ01025663.1.p1 GENE.GDKJ01025663.1~~GDKJ01025663.1.p1  ORF type:complete len:1144 (+),score=207.51 GDKJ01025663.1:22-3453(+)
MLSSCISPLLKNTNLLPSLENLEQCDFLKQNYVVTRIFHNEKKFGTTVGLCLDPKCDITTYSSRDLLRDVCVIAANKLDFERVKKLCDNIKDKSSFSMLETDPPVPKPVFPIPLNVTLTETGKLNEKGELTPVSSWNKKKITSILKCGNGVFSKDKHLASRILHSGQALQLGSFDECNSVPDAHHCVNKFQSSASAFYMGQCVPKSCSNEDMRTALFYLTELSDPMECLHMYPLVEPRICLSAAFFYAFLGPDSAYNVKYRLLFKEIKVVQDDDMAVEIQGGENSEFDLLHSSFKKAFDRLSENTSLENLFESNSVISNDVTHENSENEIVMRSLKALEIDEATTFDFQTFLSVIAPGSLTSIPFNFLSAKESLMSSFFPPVSVSQSLSSFSPILQDAFVRGKMASDVFFAPSILSNNQLSTSSPFNVTRNIDERHFEDSKYWSSSCIKKQVSLGAGVVSTSFILSVCVGLCVFAAFMQTKFSNMVRLNQKKKANQSAPEKTEQAFTSANVDLLSTPARKDDRNWPLTLKATHLLPSSDGEVSLAAVKKNELTVYDKILIAFNPRANFNSLFALKKRKHTNRQFSEVKYAVAAKLSQLPLSQEIDSVHGLRAISMFWVIFGHSFCFMWSTLPVNNLFALYDSYKTWWFPIVPGSFFAVDTFFAISGFLFTYLLILKSNRAEAEHEKKAEAAINKYISENCTSHAFENMSEEQQADLLDMSDNKKREILKAQGVKPLAKNQVDILQGVLFRVLRLLPIYALTMAIYIFVTPHMSSGPLWNYYVGFATEGNCATNWWHNLLFIDSWYPPSQNCMGWGWYLSNDMQLFVLSMVVMSFYLYRAENKKVRTWLRYGSIFATVAMILSSLGNLADFAHTYNITINTIGMMVNMRTYYYKMWARAPAYLIGMLFGCFVSENRDKVTRFLIEHTVLRRVFHCLCLSIFSTLLILPYFANQMPGVPMITPKNPNPFPHIVDVIYTTLARPLWAICICWFVISSACGGFLRLISGILSAKIFVPISRLSFVMYIIHPVIIFVNLNSFRSNFYFQSQLPFWLFSVFTLTTLVVAAVLYVLFEAPISNLINMFLMPAARAQTKAQKKEKELHLAEIHVAEVKGFSRDGQNKSPDAEVSAITGELCNLKKKSEVQF